MEEKRPSGEDTLVEQQASAPTSEAKRTFAESYRALFDRPEKSTDSKETLPAKSNQIGEFISALFKKRPEAVVEAPPVVPPPLDMEIIYQSVHGESLALEQPPIPMQETEPQMPNQQEVQVTIEELALPFDIEQQQVQEYFLENIEKAETDEPNEAKRERSHEIKKDQFTEDQNTRASSIGEILAQIHKKTSEAHAAFSRVSPPLPKGPRILQSLPPLYKKAVFSGFGVAVVVLVGAFLILK